MCIELNNEFKKGKKVDRQLIMEGGRRAFSEKRDKMYTDLI